MHFLDHGVLSLQALYVLYESASGYALFEVKAVDEIAQSTDAIQQAVADLGRFSQAVNLTAFKPFTSAADALEQCNAVSEGTYCLEQEHQPMKCRGMVYATSPLLSVNGFESDVGLTGA